MDLTPCQISSSDQLAMMPEVQRQVGRFMSYILIAYGTKITMIEKEFQVEKGTRHMGQYKFCY